MLSDIFVNKLHFCQCTGHQLLLLDSITIIIVSIAKFLIVIGSLCTYMSRNRRGCPITGVRFELFVIGYL